MAFDGPRGLRRCGAGRSADLRGQETYSRPEDFACASSRADFRVEVSPAKDT